MSKNFFQVAAAALLTLLPLFAAADEPAPLSDGGGKQEETSSAPIIPWSGDVQGIESGRRGFVHPFFSLSGHYTDNLFRTAGNREDDWVLVSTPGLWLGIPANRQPPLTVSTMIATPGGLEIGRFRSEATRRLQAFALYRADIEQHARFPAEDRTYQRAEGFFQYTTPNGTSLELLDVFEQDKDPLHFSLDSNRRLDRFHANLFQALAAVPLGRKLTFRGDYTHYRLDFDAGADSFRERQDHALAANLAYRIRPQTDLFLRYEHIVIDYEQDILPDSSEDHAYLGCEWHLSSRSRGRIMAGYGRKDFRTEETADRRDLLAEVRLDHRLTPKTSIYLQFTRKTNEPDTPTSEGTLAHRFQLGYQQRLTPRIRLDIDGYYLLEDYRKETVIADRLGVREDTYASLGFRLGYAPLSWLNVDLGYRYLERDSNFSILRYHSNTAYLRLTAVL